MERQSSRRRKARQLKKPSAPDDSQSYDSENEPAERRSRRLNRILLYPLIICALIVVLFLYQSKARASAPLQLDIPARLTSSPAHDPDAFRPRIELHPEDHAYRDPITQSFNWTVTSGHIRPDGVLKQVYLINGLFPGPTIEARSGDALTINVTNNLQELISIHWHGLHIQNSMDGVPAVTQYPISPGSSFTYQFTIPVDQSGTFWYHAHSGVARSDGLYGGIVVHEPAPRSTVRGLMARRRPVEKEFLLLVGDWYHQPAEEVLAWFMSIESFGNEPVPDSLLLNGVGAFNCSMAVPAKPVDCIQQGMDLSYLHAADKGYRLRVVNTGSLAGFTVSFDNHGFHLLQVDNIDTEPQQPSSAAGVLYPGQRMDLLVGPPQNTSLKSSLTIHLDEDCFNLPNLALAHIQTFSISHSHKNINSPANIDIPTIDIPTIDISNVPSSKTILSHLSESRDISPQVHVVYTKIQKLSIKHNIPYAFFNRTSWAPQRDPPIPLSLLPKEEWDENQFSVTATPAKDGNPDTVWVDLIVNNLDEGGHPFHLHGHHFYILSVHESSIGWGAFNPFETTNQKDVPNQNQHAGKYNFSRAMLRDTVYIPRRGHAVLRFEANNPGVWMFHCHIVWHLASGMAMLVHV